MLTGDLESYVDENEDDEIQLGQLPLITPITSSDDISKKIMRH